MIPLGVAVVPTFPPVPPHRTAASVPLLRMALGLRLLALAVAAGSGIFLPFDSPARLELLGGILGGAVLGCAQFLALRGGWAVRGEVFVALHIAVWSYLVQVSGGWHSPLFVGYLLEVPLSGVLLSRRGSLLAAGVAAVAYLGSSWWFAGAFDLPCAATAIGFLAVTAVVSVLLIEVLERQRAEIAASQAALSVRAGNLAEELRLLGDYSNGALLGIDCLGRVSSINAAGTELLRVDGAAVVGRPWQEVLQPDVAGRQAILRTLAEAVPQRGMEWVLEREHASPVGVTAELWVGRSDEGPRTWLLMSAVSSAGAGADPLRRLGEAAACVSHQIKNSLHALQGYAQEVQREFDARGQTSAMTCELLHALHTLGELAEGVLAISGAPRRVLEPVALREAVASAVRLAGRSHVRVDVTGPEREVWVSARRGELVHALFNLIDNACHASPPGERVEVAVVEGPEGAGVEIRDRGPGIVAQDGGGPVASRAGYGYGLLASRRFVEGDGGRIQFESAPGGGTRCRVSLREAPPPMTCA